MKSAQKETKVTVKTFLKGTKVCWKILNKEQKKVEKCSESRENFRAWYNTENPSRICSTFRGFFLTQVYSFRRYLVSFL